MAAQQTSQAKEQILSKIRKALSAGALPMPFPEQEKWNPQEAFEASLLTSDELFAENFIALGGKYVYCQNEHELLENLQALYDSREWSKLFCADKNLLTLAHNNRQDFVWPADNTDDTADACITNCEALIARTGSFLMSSRQDLGRVSSVFYPVHIVVAYKADVVYDIEDGFVHLNNKYGEQQPSMISIQTGPSRTADIEKTLVTGVHGPKEVFCFYVNA
ncbi:MAG: LUD domain-containing protein [Chitinophagaceae bacterium]|nr:LUD domain-containing protein [Chitinophagaceae bacterium]